MLYEHMLLLYSISVIDKANNSSEIFKLLLLQIEDSRPYAVHILVTSMTRCGACVAGASIEWQVGCSSYICYGNGGRDLTHLQLLSMRIQNTKTQILSSRLAVL